jgi:hypothetical protein
LKILRCNLIVINKEDILLFNFMSICSNSVGDTIFAVAVKNEVCGRSKTPPICLRVSCGVSQYALFSVYADSNWQGIILENKGDFNLNSSKTVSLGYTVCSQVTFICMYGAELYQYNFI